MRRISILPVTLLLVLVLFSQAGAVKDDSMCGPKALAYLCQELGVKSTPDELAGLAGYVKTEGTTLAGLKKAAIAKGLYAKAVRITLDDLAAMKLPSVALVWGEHLVALSGYSEKELTLTDFPLVAKQIPRKEMQGAFAGYALLLSKDPIVIPAEARLDPTIAANRGLWSFGSINSEAVKSHKFVLKNIGNKELVVSKVTSSCDCLTVMPMSVSRIAPGQTAELSVSFNASGLSGGQSKSVTISCNDPITPEYTLAVEGNVQEKTLPLSARAIDFGRVSKGEAVPSRFIYLNTGNDNYEIERVESLDPRVQAVLKLNDPDGDDPWYSIEVKFLPGSDLGAVLANLVVTSNHLIEKSIVVLVTAEVEGNLQYPASVYLDQGKIGSVTRKVSISTADGKTLDVGKVECSSSFLSADLVKESASRTSIELTAKNAPPGFSVGEVRVHTNDPDEPMVKIKTFVRSTEASLSTRSDK